MAILKIYKTNLDPTRNMVIENIEDYLSTQTQTYVDNNFQFVRPSLQQTIKVDIKGNYDLEGNLNLALIKEGNFIAITEKANNDQNNTETVTYYYFIMGAEWVADYTVRLTIALDTLNTWWTDITANMTERTHITREHKDRFGKKSQEFLQLEYDYKGYFTPYTPNSYNMTVELQDDAWIGASQAELVTMNTNRSDLTGTFTRLNETFNSNTGTYSFTLRYVGSINDNIYLTIRGDIQFGFPQFYYRVIDKFSEGLQPVTFGENKGEIEGDNNNWYLIYGAPKDGQGVVDKAYMRMCPKYPVNVYVPGHSTITPGTAPLTDNGYYYIVPEYSQGVYCKLVTSNGTEYYVIAAVGGSKRTVIQLEIINSSLRIRTGTRFKNQAGGTIYWDTSWETCSSIEVTNTSQVTFYYLDRNSSNIDTVLNGGQRTLSITGGNYQISSIDTIKRYASSLVKIIELPYSVIKSNGVTKEWSAVTEGGYTYLETTASTQLESYITSTYNPLNDLTVDLSNISDNDENNIVNESKLYHSDFYQPKFVYDSFTKTFALERQNINREALYAPFRINFKATNTINSRFLFDFTKYDTNGQALEDYENILVVNRNNELPLYNDEYLNYLRSGYNYDIKAKNTQTGAAVGGAALSLAGSAASIGLAVAAGAGSGSSAGPIGMGIGAAVGVIGAIISITSQAQLQANSIQQKEAQYANQAMSVRGSDDVDLLNYYSNNKAKMMLYKPSEQMTNAIYNMLRLSGYACDEYQVPEFDTRIWYNFVQCEPVFSETNNKIYQNFLDEIKNRFQLGVTVFHKRNNSWNLTQEKENYETFLFN